MADIFRDNLQKIEKAKMRMTAIPRDKQAEVFGERVSRGWSEGFIAQWESGPTWDLEKPTRKFLLWRLIDDFIVDLFLTPKGDRHFYEIISEGPRKFFLDLDLYDEDAEGAREFLQELLDDLVHIVINSWSSWTGQQSPCDLHRDLILYESSGWSKRGEKVVYKCSVHVLFPSLITTDQFQAQALFADIKSKIHPIFHNNNDDSPIYDPGVYSRNRPFRIVYNSKYKAPERTKGPLFEWTTRRYSGGYACTDMAQIIRDSLITVVNFPEIPKYQCCIKYTRPLFETVRTDSDESPSVASKTTFVGSQTNIRPEAPEGFRIGNETYGKNGKLKIRLDRETPSLCVICQRVHESENMYFTYWEHGSGRWYLHCPRAEAERRNPSSIIWA